MKNYWTNKYTQLVINWKDANQLEQVKIYNELLPPIKYMSISIQKKYFNFNQNDSEELSIEAINHCFLSMNKFNPNVKTSAYSYIGTIIKNFYIDKMKIINKENTKLEIQFYGDDFELFYNTENEIENEIDITFYLIKLNKKLNSLNQIKLSKVNKSNVKTINEIIFIKSLIKFLTTYEINNIDPQAIHDYIYVDTGIGVGTIAGLMHKYFNIYTNNQAKSNSQNDRLKLNVGLINDDFVYSSVYERGLRLSRVKRLLNKKHIFM